MTNILTSSVVYLIVNKVNGKLYVGKTIRTIKARWAQHVSEAYRNKDDFLLNRAIRKYGPDAFEITTAA